MIIKSMIALLFSSCVLSVNAAPAEPAHQHKAHQRSEAPAHNHQTHGAHVHGEAELTIAQEGGQVDIVLASPAVNIVGFERSTGSPEQAAVIQRAETRLTQAEKLFTFNGGECDLQSASADLSELRHVSDGETHHDIEAQFRYQCKKPGDIHELEVRLFKVFFDLEKVSAQWVTDTGQGARQLTKRDSMLTLR